MSKKNRAEQHGMQGVFIFVLLGLFALMSTLMVLLGAQMYRSAVSNASENNARRVLSAYLRSMVRAEDAFEAVKIEDHDGVTTLALYEDIDEDPYVTWIYPYDGQVMEQFTSAGYDFDPADGTPIVAAKAMKPELQDGLLTVRLMNDLDELSEVQVALRCAQ